MELENVTPLLKVQLPNTNITNKGNICFFNFRLKIIKLKFVLK